MLDTRRGCYTAPIDVESLENLKKENTIQNRRNIVVQSKLTTMPFLKKICLTHEYCLPILQC